MSEDAELLRRYAAEGSEAAFADLVRRHVDLVYSAALRLLNGDSHRAQDVTQQVFTELARQAKRLANHPAIIGWLYTTTRLMASRVIRSETRRQAREREADSMSELLRETNSEPAWEQLRPVLEDAMHELGEIDRGAVLLRFFKNKSLGEVGRELGLSENAARMRVERALEKLRSRLVRKGVTSTSSALAVALSANAVTAAPAGFVTTLASASLAGAAGTGTTLILFQIMATTKLKLGIAALAVASVAATLVMQKQSEAALRRENESLRAQVSQLATDKEGLSNRLAHTKSARTPRLPAPAVQAVSSSGPVDSLDSSGLYDRLKDGKKSKLKAEQVAAYLEANHRSAASLLAAYRTTDHDPAMLEEAKKNFPNNPQVAFEAAFDQNATPEDRQKWMDVFKKSDPENALPNYLSALDAFKAGNTDQAVQEIMAASGKAGFQDYTQERAQDDEEAYLAAGYSVAEAKTVSSQQLLLPQLLLLKNLGIDMVGLANSYTQNGDAASAQDVLQMVATLGQRYSTSSPGEPEISQLVGMALETKALSAMDPNSTYADGQTVQQRLDQLSQEKATLQSLNQQAEPLFAGMSDADWVIYKDRWRSFGEESALRWVISKYGQQSSQ